MAWEDVLPQVGRVAVEGREITVAWRRTGSDTSNRLVISIAKVMMDRLGWGKGTRIRVQRDRLAGKVRLCGIPANAPQSEKRAAFTMRDNDRTGQMILRLDGLTLAETKKAEHVGYEVEGKALVFTLPDWAAPERMAAEAAAAAKRMPAGMTADDLAEAIGFIGTGVKDSGLAEYFGWDDGLIAYARKAAAERVQAVQVAHRRAA